MSNCRWPRVDAYEIHSFLDAAGQPRYGGQVLDPEAWAALSTSALMIGFVAFLGALWGSFANVCIYRLPPTEAFPRGQSVVAPGSHCFACGASVRWYDNVPLLSYLWLRGQCRDCKAEFSPRYLLVEAGLSLLFVAVFYSIVAIEHTGDTPKEQLLRFAIMAAFCFTMMVIAFIDLDHHLILNKVTYIAIPVFYGLGLLLPGAHWQTGLIGAAVGYGGIRGIADLFWLLTKREGMGYGDGKLLAIVGALFGWQGVFVALFLGSVIGTVILVPIMVGKRIFSAKVHESSGDGEKLEQDEEQLADWRQVEIPFGPFLTAAAVAYVFLEARLRVEFFFLW